MDTWVEAYGALQSLDALAAESGADLEAYLDGQAVVMFYGHQEGSDLEYRDTDDVDLLLRDPSYLSLAEEYGFVFGGSGNIPVRGEEVEIDMLVDEDAADLLDEERQRNGTQRVEGLDSITVYVPPAELFAQKKRDVGRDKDIEDADRLEQIIASLD